MPLSPLLASRLEVVFVGTEPGSDSVRLAQYYANPTNRFYKHLAATQFTPHQLLPAEFRTLLKHGIGLDDVYDDPGALRLRLEVVAPRAVCFNSGDAFTRYASLEKLPQPWRRDAAANHASIGEAIIWATSDSSFNASRHWPLRLGDLHALHERLLGS
jgi:TDG/mug DNA glycosylase family protein